MPSSMIFPKCDTCGKAINYIDIDLCSVDLFHSYLIKAYCSIRCKVADEL
jgi:hypothetical protein